MEDEIFNQKHTVYTPEFGVAVFAAETRQMEDLVVGHQSLHWIDRLLT